MVEILLNYGANPNLQNCQDTGFNTPLHLAAMKNDLSIFELLLNVSGCDATIKNKSNFTPLHIACRVGNLEMVKLLKAKGVDLEPRDSEGFSPAYWAKEFDHFEICGELPPPKKQD